MLFFQAGCSGMACAISKAGSDENAVPYCALREAVHLLILEGCSKCGVVRMRRHAEIKSIDISGRNEDFWKKREVTQGDGQGLA